MVLELEAAARFNSQRWHGPRRDSRLYQLRPRISDRTAAPAPISVEVGWTLNDYQIDVGTPEGVAEYRRIIDTASELGIRTLLYAPANSKLSERTKSTHSWSWEYVLWLGLGEKIRTGDWDPLSSPVPAEIREMITYAKQKHVDLLAYVYPSIPYSHDDSWLVEGNGDRFTYASLASRKFQDYLIRNLVAFQRRTGIAGYSFDYTWLNLPRSSSYAQWFGWRRVMESLRRESPHIVIDGRQSYQMYGPWSWLAGSYPHPTRTDGQTGRALRHIPICTLIASPQIAPASSIIGIGTTSSLPQRSSPATPRTRRNAR